MICPVTGKKLLTEFVEQHPTILQGHNFETKLKLVKTKVFNERKKKRELFERNRKRLRADDN